MRLSITFLRKSIPFSFGRAFSSPGIRPDLDFDYLLDEKNVTKIKKNIGERKGIGNIDTLHGKWKAIESIMEEARVKKVDEEEYKKMWDDLYEEALLIPNESHPLSPKGDEAKCEIVCEIGEKRFHKKAVPAEKVVQSWRALLHPTDACGQRSYGFLGPLANLEKAVLDHVYENVLACGFKGVVVPDLVSKRITQACGLIQRDNQHSIQYFLSADRDVALSGTGEMGISSLLQGRTFQEGELPLRIVTQSRCFRPEISNSASEARLYRVHEFSKVEMFVVCSPEQSEDELDKLVQTQKYIFDNLGIHARVLNMSTEELGAPASRKFDIEAWMPGRGIYGEVSSASNCTDFQSRRLNIRYAAKDGSTKHVHTCNGTAVASTRTLISLLETYQTERRGLGELPEVICSRLGASHHKPLKFQVAAPLS